MAQDNDATTIETARAHDSLCGSIGDIGGAWPGLSKNFRREWTRGCQQPATRQVWDNSVDPIEHTTIVCVCDDHIDDAKQYIIEELDQ